MCGIVGYIGREQAAPILLNGLGRLEYRGYDSAGICVAADGVLHVEKCKGRLANLEEKTEHGALLPGTLGIGHTRWATHGEPNDINSHPHLSQNGKIALVHNGIIENYLEIRTFLEEKGVKFVSQTDSEVVAQLLEYCLGLPETNTVPDAIYMVLHRIEGAYAFGIVCADDCLTMLNKKSGVLALSDGISSDFRDLDKAAEEGNEAAQLALDKFAYEVRKYIGAYTAALGAMIRLRSQSWPLSVCRAGKGRSACSTSALARAASGWPLQMRFQTRA